MHRIITEIIAIFHTKNQRNNKTKLSLLQQQSQFLIYKVRTEHIAIITMKKEVYLYQYIETIQCMTQKRELNLSAESCLNSTTMQSLLTKGYNLS